MPLYEFQCQACGHKFDKLRKIEERSFTNCPECGARTTPIISVVNHTFGWILSEESHIRGPDELVRNI